MDNSTVNNEKELLAKVAQGDEAAFTQLFFAYHHKLGAYIYRLTQSKEIAKEIVHDVFLKIWLNRKRLTTVERFGAYLYVLSRNRTLNYLRQLAKERVKEKEVLAKLKSSYQENEAEDNHSEYYKIMDQAVEKLPPQQQKVYILSRRKRLKYNEIAQQMGISKETVKKYLQLATHSITNYVRSHSNLFLIIFLSLFLLL